MKTEIAQLSPRIIVKENKTEGVLSYDRDNAYPQRRDRIVSWSGTAQACLRIYSRFLIGGGLKDETFYKTPVNRTGLTADKLHRHCAEDLARNRGVAIQVNFNALGEPVEAYPVKFGDVRISDDKTHAVLYDDWGRERKKSLQKDRIHTINWWDPDPEVIAAQVAAAGGWDTYRGQIYYWTPTGVGSEADYPVPIYDSQLEDMETEGGLQRFRNRTVSTNFLGSHVIVTNKSEQVLDEEGKPVESDDDGPTLIQSFEQFQGADNASSIMEVELDQPDDTFKIEKLELQNYDGLYEKTETSVKESILESFIIPKILLLRGTASLGDGKQFEEAKEFYNDVTADDRLILEEIFTEIFPKWATPINPSGDYSITPVKVVKQIEQEYFPYFSKNEIRESKDYPPVEEAKADTKLLVEVLGVGGTQALTEVLTNPSLTQDQKLGTLQIIFGLSKTQAESMLGLNSETQTEPQR